MVQCPKCGFFLEEQAKFCTNCGDSLDRPYSIEKTNFGEVIQNKFNELNTLNFIGLECLKCGSHSSLTLFKQTQTISVEHRRYTNYKTKSINIPLCQNCNSELTSWIQKHPGTKSRTSYKDVGCMTFFGLAFGIGMSFTFPLVSVLIFIVMTLGFIYVINQRNLKNKVSSPFRYIKFRLNKTYVKPKGEGEWIKFDAWLNTITQQNHFAFY
ncbi:MAG: zinc ribbon domain-containing protein [Promethearchaeota archaeon]